MKVLIVNKFLYPNGGSETYIFEIGKQLEKLGHEVQFFGMEHKGRIVGNNAESYTSDMDFHTGKMSRLTYPFKILYSFEARRRIRKVLDDMQPDVVHLNNINFQITPSIIDEIISYRKKTGTDVKIVSTAHDYQWICPNHMMRVPESECNCDKCVGGRYINCTKNKCIHGSMAKSLLGAMEARLYRIKKTYKKVDTVICPSVFLFDQFRRDSLFKGCNLIAKHNFFLKGEDFNEIIRLKKKDYVLYFGRYSKEKGIITLINAIKQLPEIPFVFAGSGPLENELKGIDNIENKGFLSGQELHKLIREAKFAIYPSEWYENCPFAVMEAISYGTPVIGSRIGGIPELIGENGTGVEFVSGDVNALTESIHRLWNDLEKQNAMEDNCKKTGFDTVESYTDWLVNTVYGK